MAYEEVTYEGYGPGGVAVMLQVLTDNRNRTTAEIRHLFGKHGGNLGESGCVSFLFKKQGYIIVPKSAGDEDEVMEAALEVGAEDFFADDPELYEIYTAPEDLHKVKTALEARGLVVEQGKVDMVPTTQVRLGGQARRADGSAHGGLRGSRRRAERLGELRHRREAARGQLSWRGYSVWTRERA